MGSVINQTVRGLGEALCFFDIFIESTCVRKPLVILRKYSIGYNCSEAKLNKLSVRGFFLLNMKYLRLALNAKRRQSNTGTCF